MVWVNMKSSVAVFTREDPFPPPPTQKTWYHPSRRQNPTQKKSSNKTAGPGRTSRPDNPQSTKEPRPKRGLNRKPGPPQTPVEDHHLTFPESWPSTDPDSHPTEETFSPKRREVLQEDSVLAKYVERFRYGEPRSRAQRRPVSSAGGEEAHPFWWMAPSSLPSRAKPEPCGPADDAVPLKEDRLPGSPSDRREELGTPGPCREALDVSTLELSDCSLEDHWDPEGVQERASKLLLRSEGSVSSSSPEVSSEGLGGSGWSPLSVTEPVPRPFSSRPMESSAYSRSSASPPVGVPSQKTDQPTPWGARQRPEEDILFQWRLRRKMEQARHCPPPLCQPFPSLPQTPSAWQIHVPTQHPSAWQGQVLAPAAPAWQTSGLPQAAVSGGADHQQTTNQEPGPPRGATPLVLLGPQPGGVGASGPGAPCPPPGRPASAPPAAVEPCLWGGAPGAAPSAPPPAQPDAVTNPPPAVLPAVGERESRPSVGPSESRREESRAETRPSERGRMKTKTRNSRRPAGEGPGPLPVAGGSRPRPDKMVASTPQRSSQSKEKWGDGAPSPVQQALRQVVSEVLFPPRGSSSSSSSSSVTRRCAPPLGPPGPPRVGADPRSPAEVVSQLLQDAEDSDGEEFADDSLLRVLRKQRLWVKDQISQVDSLLEEFPPEGEVT